MLIFCTRQCCPECGSENYVVAPDVDVCADCGYRVLYRPNGLQVGRR